MNIKKQQPKKTQKFFGHETEVNERFIFVEEMTNFITYEDNDKNIHIELQVYDSQKDEHKLEKIVMVAHPDVYNEVFFQLLFSIDAASKIRRICENSSEVKQVSIDSIKNVKNQKSNYEQN